MDWILTVRLHETLSTLGVSEECWRRSGLIATETDQATVIMTEGFTIPHDAEDLFV